LKNKDYWVNRLEILEHAVRRRDEKFIENVEMLYISTLDTIEKDIDKWFKRLAENNGVSLLEARKLLNANELKEFKWTVQQYIKKGQENAVNQAWMKELENASARAQISRLTMLQMQIRQHMELLGAVEDTMFKGFIEDQYMYQYYHVAHEVAIGTNVAIALQAVDTLKLEKLMSKPWAADGLTFSNRIWKRKEEVINELYIQLTQSLARGVGPEETTRLLYKKLGDHHSRYEIRRLVITESAFFASTAQKDVFNDLDVELYQFISTLDRRTSTVCREMDNVVMEMKNYQPGTTAPPLHPFCRSVTVPYFDDSTSERYARDAEGEGIYVPSDMKFQEWYDKFIKE
jgi:SPP1 gp7 family putative phage head morphogenesis protein